MNEDLHNLPQSLETKAGVVSHDRPRQPCLTLSNSLFSFPSLKLYSIELLKDLTKYEALIHIFFQWSFQHIQSPGILFSSIIILSQTVGLLG
jgi:hypothetical protein